MTRRRRHIGAAGLVAGWLLGGCASPVQLYAGGTRSSQEVADIKLSGTGRFLEIDGSELDGRAYELLAGDHAIRFKIEKTLGKVHHALRYERLRYECDAIMRLTGGHEYRIRMDVGKPKKVSETIAGRNSRFGARVELFDATLGTAEDYLQSCQLR